MSKPLCTRCALELEDYESETGNVCDFCWDELNKMNPKEYQLEQKVKRPAQLRRAIL